MSRNCKSFKDAVLPRDGDSLRLCYPIPFVARFSMEAPNASSTREGAFASIAGSTRPQRPSVVPALEWPMRSLSTFGGTPLERKRVAWSCRESRKRMRGSSMRAGCASIQGDAARLARAAVGSRHGARVTATEGATPTHRNSRAWRAASEQIADVRGRTPSPPAQSLSFAIRGSSHRHGNDLSLLRACSARRPRQRRTSFGLSERARS
jgi:hypothetical protein